MKKKIPKEITAKIEEYVKFSYKKINAQQEVDELLSEILTLCFHYRPDVQLNSSAVLNSFFREAKSLATKERDRFNALVDAITAIFHHDAMVKNGVHLKRGVTGEMIEVEVVSRIPVKFLISRDEAASISGWKQQNFFYHERNRNLIPFDFRGEMLPQSSKEKKYYNREKFTTLLKRLNYESTKKKNRRARRSIAGA